MGHVFYHSLASNVAFLKPDYSIYQINFSIVH